MFISKKVISGATCGLSRAQECRDKLVETCFTAVVPTSLTATMPIFAFACICTFLGLFEATFGSGILVQKNKCLQNYPASPRSGTEAGLCSCLYMQQCRYAARCTKAESAAYSAQRKNITISISFIADSMPRASHAYVSTESAPACVGAPSFRKSVTSSVNRRPISGGYFVPVPGAATSYPFFILLSNERLPQQRL